MTAISAYDQSRSVSTLDCPFALEVILLKRTYVLPWSQFLYAEGGNDEIRLAFSTHDVLVEGSNLEEFIAAIAAKGVARIEEATRSDRMLAGTSTIIRNVSVRKIDQDRA
jgi:hypothetical protein